MNWPFKDMEWKVTWSLVGFLFFSAFLALVNDRIFFFVMSGWALYLALYPPLRYRDPRIMPALELVTLLTIPFVIFVVGMFFPALAGSVGFRVAELMAVYFVGLVLMIHLQRYRGLVLDRVFLVFFMVVFTTALGVIHALGQYFNDQLFGTNLVPSNDVFMTNIGLSLLGGILMSLVLLLYLRRRGIYRILPPEYQVRGSR